MVQPNIFSTFVDQVKRLLALSDRRFEAIRHKTHSKRKGGRSLLQRSLCRIPGEQPTEEIIVSLANS